MKTCGLPVHVALAATLAAVLAPAATTASPNLKGAPKSCWPGYSYNGIQSAGPGFGVTAILRMQSRSLVTAGHVAAWVGVGGAGMGPGGSDSWVQAGIAQDAGGTGHLYYEFKRPGDAEATYVTLAGAKPGEAHRVTVYERRSQYDAWRVAIDRVRVSDPILLPGSHGTFAPVATAENWDGDAGACNPYSFVFSRLAVETRYGADWQPFAGSRVLSDPAYEITLRAHGFTASSR